MRREARRVNTNEIKPPAHHTQRRQEAPHPPAKPFLRNSDRHTHLGMLHATSSRREPTLCMHTRWHIMAHATTAAAATALFYIIYSSSIFPKSSQGAAVIKVIYI